MLDAEATGDICMHCSSTEIEYNFDRKFLFHRIFLAKSVRYISCDGAWTLASQRKSTVRFRKHIAFKLRPRLRLCHQHLNSECPSENVRSSGLGLGHHVNRCEARKMPAPSYSHSQHPASRLCTDLDVRTSSSHTTLFSLQLRTSFAPRMTMPLLIVTHSAPTARKSTETLKRVTTMLFSEKICPRRGFEG